jgi:osmotically-inducible protein OsmY
MPTMIETKSETKTDSQIQQDVLRELRWDARVKETEVGVEVDKGVVTLSGTVESYAKKLAARDAAHRVSGVLDVADDIEVRIPGSLVRTDTEVAKAVRTALEWHVFLPDEKIRSTVSNGWVTLQGEVENLVDFDDAERAVRWLHGVKGVTNSITVTAKKADPARVRKAIEEALERRAEREASRIDVNILDGKVKLEGRVHSWPEKQAILGAVRQAPGVRFVDADLKIEPYF